jgi:hypothetical protein
MVLATDSLSLISRIISRNLIAHISIYKELGPYRLCHGARGAHCSLNFLTGAARNLRLLSHIGLAMAEGVLIELSTPLLEPHAN